jgi:hypothetical protein
MAKKEKMFIADKKVADYIVDQTTKTPMGGEMISVLYDDGTDELMPKKRFDLVVTKEISDESKMRETIRQSVGTTMFGVLHEYGILFNEVNSCLDTIAELVNNSSARSYEILLGYKKEKVPLNVINDILVDDFKKKKEDGNKESEKTG